MPLSLPTYRELAQRWKNLRDSHDVRVREVACVGAPRTLLCAEFGDAALPAIHLSGGVHGDEPAGVLALLRLVESGMLDRAFSYRIWPCTNPTGFDARTRVNADGVDINRTFGRGGTSPEASAVIMSNRDRKFVLAVDLHEDDQAGGPYCYEYGDRAIGERIVPECLRPDPIEEAELLGGLSLSLLMRRGAADDAITLETPAHATLDERVDMHVRMVQAAIASLR
ncbi:MAG: succinylglutamate desuccinylase/aspartoacylase family protein [Candidatus Eremiobacteraeota bacterium]|nr:succinylglutamate desuccinylase/aspartoacylase family protein [Candidatus Eremiobacteraeota bacterium]